MTDGSDSSLGTVVHAASGFAPTRWTLVLAAQGETPEAKAALSELCEAYWTPVFRFLRRDGRNEELSRELTQEFFARILARDGFGHATPTRGRFRSFLLGAVIHFLSDLRDRERAVKRGAGTAAEPLSMSEDGAESPSPLPIDNLTTDVSDAYFDRQWAFALIDRAFEKLTGEMANAGKAAHFTALKPWLIGDSDGSPQSSAANSLGLSEGAIKVAIHRLRKRFRELVRAEVAQTVPDTADVDGELRYLVEVLAAGR